MLPLPNHEVGIADPVQAETEFENQTIGKVYRRVMPIIFLSFVIAYVDRTNIGMAALQMNAALGLSPTVFATGAGIFFLGYVFLEIPSNLILARTGARIWVARIMITWGVVSSACAFVSGPTSFYFARFLLGAAEAGFFPGVVLYLTYWFPAPHRARAAAVFLVAIPTSAIIGAPLSGMLLSLDGAGGLTGWQWMFILEGVPSVVLGIIVLARMTNRPEQASWLNRDEVGVLARRLAAEDRTRHHFDLRGTFTNRGVLLLAMVNILWVTGFYGMVIWLPQIIKAMGGFTNFQVGLISAIPALLAVPAMFLWSQNSDRTGDRVYHAAASGVLAGVGLVVSALTGTPAVELIAVIVGMVGAYCFLPVFWAIPQQLLGGTAAAAGIALISAIGNTGGFFGPYLVGWMNAVFGDFHTSLIALGVLFFASSFAVVAIRNDAALRHKEA